MLSTSRLTRLLTFSVALSAFSSAANAAEIKLIASNAVREAYVRLLPAFEKESGNKVRVIWGGTGEIVKRIDDGEAADLVIVTDSAIDGLIKKGRLINDGSYIVAKSPVGAAVRAGMPKPDLSSPEAVKKTILASKSIMVTTGPSNSLLYALFDRLGVGKEMRAKEVLRKAGEEMTDPLLSGKVDIVFSQASELFAVKGVTYAGVLPQGADIVLTYVAAFHKAAPQPQAAKALLEFLASSEAAKILRQNGLEPS